ncbi:MAG: hypothetical protein JXR78_09030 [Victivallales bacterium]|nr:hypothetical protein [Victivallales bacterium]
MKLSYITALAIYALIFSLHAENLDIKFKDASGACQGGSYHQLWETTISWNRFDINWVHCEPEEGKWNDKYYNRVLDRIKKNIELNIKVLPVLAYAPGWASATGKHIHQTKNKRFEYTSLGNGNYRKIEYKREKNEFVQVQEREIKSPRIPLNPQKLQAWRNFIAKVVADLSQPPYNIEYFQIWNEAHPNSGYWDGNMDTYIQQIHIPASEEIRKLGRKVVYGGYPVCGTVGHLVNLLDKHNAWKTIDILSTHYYSVQWMEYLRRNADKRGHKNMGIWQTEVGFHSNYYYVPQIYPVFIHWGLSNNWNYIDRYKFFFFAYGSPNDPKAYGYGKCLLKGNKLTPHGQALKILAELFANSNISVYENVKTNPELKFNFNGSRMVAFKSGSKIIVSIGFENKHRAVLHENQKYDIDITLPELPIGKISHIERIGAFGNATNITSSATKNNEYKTSVTVSTKRDNSINSYSNLHLKHDENPVEPTFYVVFHIK